jgi:hypothetical protein
MKDNLHMESCNNKEMMIKALICELQTLGAVSEL